MSSSVDTSGAATAARPGLRRPVLAGIAVALVGLLLTASATGALVSQANADTADELDRIARDIDTLVNRRVAVAEAALLTMAAHISAGAATSSEVQRVLGRTGVVEAVPGLLAMVYAGASTTADGQRITPRAIHPLGPNVAILGRNLLGDPERRRAIEAARDDGRTTATSIVTHVDGGVDAILVMVPVFDGPADTLAQRRDSFRGVMIAVLSPPELFAAVTRMPVEVAVEDLGPTSTSSGLSGEAAARASEEAFVWRSGSELSDATRTRTTRLGDRQWRFAVAPGADFPVTLGAATVAAVAGVLLSVLLGLLVAEVVGRRNRLAQLVAERTRELRQSNEELERAGRLRAQFITTVSHELRTPLTSVLGFVQTLRRMDHADRALYEDLLVRAERNGLTLHRMIEELLDFGRLERGDMVLDRRPRDLSVAVAASLRDLEPTLDGREVVLRLDPGTWAEVDDDALRRIVANLVGNTMRYAPEAGPIEVSVRRIDAQVELLCRDRGPGFLERDLPVLCERFVRGTGVMGQGTGIGLSLVRDLALAHGGWVELGNRPGGGAEVLVTFPASSAPDTPHTIQAATARPQDPLQPTTSLHELVD